MHVYSPHTTLHKLQGLPPTRTHALVDMLMQTVFSAFHIMRRKTASLCVSWKTDHEGKPPGKIRDLLPEDLHRGTSAFIHWADYVTIYRKTALLPSDEISLTLTVQSLKDCLALCCQDEEKEKVIRESFHFLHTDDFSMKLGSKCEDHIAVYTGEDFMLLNKDGRIRHQPTHDPIPSHPMMKAVMALSKATLKTFSCSGLKAVITGKNVIYVALLYMNDTPAYYVGKAKNGIKARWCEQRCKEVNNIIYCFESTAGHFEPVVHHQQCDLAIAGAVLKQVATRRTDGMATEGTDGVALFAIDYICPKETIKKGECEIMCCSPTDHSYNGKPCKGQSQRPALDHYEQHYMNAFAELFPDSDTEPKMKCLNASDPCLCHYCSDGDVRRCGTEVALSLFLHDLQLVSEDSSTGKQLLASKKSKVSQAKKKTCRCGSTSHSRTKHRDCPLNKSAVRQ